MIIQALAFYIFAAITVASAVMVISARNSVHSVLFLILAFFNAAALFVLIGAEFLAMILVVVYVGAVAVLFLFVVMMLDINFAELRAGFLRYLPIGALIGVVLLVELFLLYGSVGGPSILAAGAAHAGPTNTAALGQLIYTQYAFPFQAAGLVLLVAMIGAIVLTLRHRAGVRRQVISQQLARRREEVMVIKKIGTGEGA
ncbi:NADH-quinone oxidoreductase subunit J [Inquilinus limosus]|uniref:NADH-quinone oxidoreductase subunit J n=1 Tax=Inquilinus limosus MP06 TaxID=1398085 RepID=A0A0A0DEM4_9PROT|nr:NADH-quinone oxidoreductase subunit J [Inquilinus limosus]KGM35427.1 NADH:ubiquinone oxidoreductase subunit J [Inquilinus limosus MP06]